VKRYFSQAIILGIIIVLGLYYFFPKKKGTIIILNGSSGIGKSKIQKELQDILPEPYLSLGIKKLFFGAIPEKYLKTKKELIEGTLYLKPKPLYKLNFKKESFRVISAMHKTIAVYAKEGNNIIVDYVLYEKHWLKSLMNELKDFNVYFVGITMPLEILEKNERENDLMQIGHARSYYDTVHFHGTYDIELDMQNLSPKTAAEKIYSYLQKHPKPLAFEKLT
jgi:chloramphenicol 3-O phosphotransferase